MDLTRVNQTLARADHLRLIAHLRGAKRGESGKHMRMAVRNERGDIYLVIGTRGLPEFMGTVAALLRLGFVDELEDAQERVDGYDGIFCARRPQPPLSAV